MADEPIDSGARPEGSAPDEAMDEGVDIDVDLASTRSLEEGEATAHGEARPTDEADASEAGASEEPPKRDDPGKTAPPPGDAVEIPAEAIGAPRAPAMDPHEAPTYTAFPTLASGSAPPPADDASASDDAKPEHVEAKADDAHDDAEAKADDAHDGTEAKADDAEAKPVAKADAPRAPATYDALAVTGATVGLSGASQLPPAPVEAIEAVAAAVDRLRAEVDATTEDARRARLLCEAAEIQERAGDEPGAARDYLAAYNADTTFREPLEGLLRLLERRRTLANLGKLIEALVSAAVTPEERARALTQRAVFAADVQNDLEGARGAAREATETGATAADAGPAWLALELVAAKLDDAALREEALAGRADLTTDRAWRGLLLVDAARLAAKGGETDRALETLERVRGFGSLATYGATVEAERIVRGDPGLSGTEEAKSRARKHAEALEARADLVRDALGDDAHGDATGVPRHVRRLEHVADLLLRAAESRRAAGETAKAASALDRALDALSIAAPRAEDERTSAGRDALAAIERVVLTARLRVAESMGDTALASELSTRRLVGETDGGVAAALGMRIAEHAASEGDIAKALEALQNATARDPVSAPARALETDILEAFDAPKLAAQLEELSKHFTKGEAQGRALLLAAFVWATRAHDAGRAREALGQAEACGVPKDLVTQLARSLASVLDDDAWYEAATLALLELGASGAEAPLLAIELGRLRLAQGDEAGAAKAFAVLRAQPEGAWLARVLDALAPAEGVDTGKALEELAGAASDPALRRSLLVATALRAHETGDAAAALTLLRSLASEDARDALVSSFLADALRAAGDRAAVADLARTAAEAHEGEDPEQAAARHLEAGFERFRLGDRAGAVASFEAASAASKEAAAEPLAWVRRAVDVDGLDGRRAAAAAARGDAGAAMERFGLEALLGDPDDAAVALASVEIASSESLRLASALARLAWPRGAAEEDAVASALDALAATGERGRTAAAAERLRLAREGVLVTTSDDVAAAAAHWLDEGGGGAAALEWLAATMAQAEPEKEVPPRRALAELFSDELREAMHASATLLDAVLRPDKTFPLVNGSSLAARLANLELSPPGCDPRRRASALAELDQALGEDSELDALALAGWSALAAGDPSTALDVFRTVTATRSDDLAAWEGMRAAAEALGSHEAYAVACEQLGARCAGDGRAAAFWEQAALAWTKLGGAFEQRAEAALDASVARDPRRQVAFDRLFRRVRDRKDSDKVLALVATRLAVSDDPQEIARLYWEQARALREKGDPEGALAALEHVTMFDENHVGALALTGEIFIRRGMFAEAAEKLAKLARVDQAPPKNRVTAGVAAVDLYENKLARHDLALGVLVDLHRAGLSTLPVRERLARAAARTGSWREATQILEELMLERPEQSGRIEAARLAMAIHRDRLRDPRAGMPAATKLLSESPGDGEALDLVVSLDPSTPNRRPLLDKGRDAVLMYLHEHPNDGAAHARLARICHAVGDAQLEQSALACSISLLGPDGASEQMLALLASKKPRVPQVAMTEPLLRQILAPGDDGSIASLFVALGPTLAEALGPLPAALGVTKKDKIDPRSGLALRNEIASWAGAFGIGAFDLYVGGKDPAGVQGIPGETPAIVVGSAVNAPLSPATRARVARELLGIVRGSTITRWRDDQTVAAVVVAACKIVKVPAPQPPYAVLAEVERVLGKAISGKTKKLIEPLCRAYVQSGQDPKVWATRARSSQNRVAALASGDVSVVLGDVFGETVDRLGAVARDDLRAHDLFRFVLSRPYFDVRRALGLEGQS